MPATPRAAALAVAAAAALALTASGSALASGFRVSNASVLEGTGATTTLRFTVTYEPSGSDPASANVAYQTADGSAVNPADYAFAGGSLFFNGPGSQPVDVTVNGDSVAEACETLQLRINGIGSPDHMVGTGTIIDDDGGNTSCGATGGGSGGGSGGFEPPEFEPPGGGGGGGGGGGPGPD